MPFSSVEYAILQDLVLLGQAAGLTGVSNSNHLIRELPKIGETVNTLPSVFYCPHASIQSDPMSFEGDAGRIYTEGVYLVDGREGDNATYQSQAQTWHEQLLRYIEKDPATGQFRTTLANVASVWSIEIVEAGEFDKSKLESNYACLPIVVRVRSVE